MNLHALPAELRRPPSLETLAASTTELTRTAQRSLEASVSGDEGRETRITLSQTAISSLRHSEISLARGREETHASDAERFAHGVDRAVRRIGRSIEKLLARLERLQDRAERIGERLSERILEDIAEGRFDDRTQDRIATRLLHKAGRLERAAERITDRLAERLERLGELTGHGDAELDLDYAQSISLSVRQVEIEVAEGDETVRVSVQRVVFESSASLSVALAENTPAADDPAPAEEAVPAATADGDEPPAVTETPSDPVPAPQSGAALAAQGVLVLLRSTSFSAESFSLSFDAAARTGGAASAVLQASSFSVSQQTSRLLSIAI